jgi:hypothetical protein
MKSLKLKMSENHRSGSKRVIFISITIKDSLFKNSLLKNFIKNTSKLEKYKLKLN